MENMRSVKKWMEVMALAIKIRKIIQVTVVANNNI